MASIAIERRARRRLVRACLAAYLASVPWTAAAASDPVMEAHWLERSRAPGVVYANNFSTASSVYERVLRDRRADHVAWDRAVYASGGGSLRFEIRVGDGPSSGNWRDNFSSPQDGFDVSFGANEPFYVQFRYRRSANLDGTVFPVTRGTGGRKIVIIGEGDRAGWNYGDAGEAQSCSVLELVTNDGAQRGIFQNYHSCGKFIPYHDRFESACKKRDFRLQTALDRGAQGFSGCEEDRRRYSLRSQHRTMRGKPLPGDGSVALAVEQWQTLLIKVSPGPLGIATRSRFGKPTAGFTDSRYETWIADEAADYVKIDDLSGLVFRRRDGDADTAEKYGKIWFTPYHTGQDGDAPWPLQTSAFVWYDELIVSTEPIAAPRGGVPGGRP